VREITGSRPVAERYAALSRAKVLEGFSRQAIFERTEKLLLSVAGREAPDAGHPAPSAAERHVARL
jgi:hypothetical protein